jgi:hypothetical protein
LSICGAGELAAIWLQRSMPDEAPPDETLTDELARRRGKNEAAFRRMNEQLAREASGWTGSTFDCICECSRPGCLQRIEILTVDYERVRGGGDRFVLAHGHEDPSIEVVVDTHPNYVVVEKIGAAGEVARETDPR